MAFLKAVAHKMKDFARDDYSHVLSDVSGKVSNAAAVQAYALVYSHTGSVAYGAVAAVVAASTASTAIDRLKRGDTLEHPSQSPESEPVVVSEKPDLERKEPDQAGSVDQPPVEEGWAERFKRADQELDAALRRVQEATYGDDKSYAQAQEDFKAALKRQEEVLKERNGSPEGPDSPGPGGPPRDDGGAPRQGPSPNEPNQPPPPRHEPERD